MTAIGVFATQQDLDQKRAELFEHQAHELTRVVEERIEAATALLAGIDGLFSTGEIGRRQFHDYVASLENSPGFDALGAVGFDRMVRREEVPSFEDQVRSDTSLNDVGYPEYAVFPPGDSEVLYIIDYVEPGAGENASLGFDVASNPERRVSVDKARDSGALVATPGVAFLDGSIGVLLFSPVYTPGIDPTGLDERRDAFVGVIAGGFRIDELLADMSYPAGVNLVLTDEGVIGDVETVSTVLTTAGSSSPAIEGGLLVQHDIPVADRDWMVTIAETEAGFGAASAWALPRILLVLGLVATAASYYCGMSTAVRMANAVFC